MSRELKLYIKPYYVLYLILALALFAACREKKVDPFCYTQIIEELTYKVDSTGLSIYPIHRRNKISCEGVCPDGTPCDSLLELTVTSMGEPVRRVRCGCKTNPNPLACDIMMETIRREGDTLMTYYKCISYTKGCPNPADQCQSQQRPGPTDTIHSVLSGLDSLIIKRTIHICECVNGQ